MTDVHWLSAIAKYSHDTTSVTRNGTMLGGASQLAQQLGRCTEQNPDRFAALTFQFPDDTNPSYFDAILRALAKTADQLNLEHLVAVCERCHSLPSRPCGRALAYLIGTVPNTAFPDRLLGVLAWYAKNAPDPPDELWRTKVPSGDDYFYAGDIESAGLNSDRGAAAFTIARLINADTDRVEYFKPTLKELVQDRSIAVRVCAARALTAALPYDRDRAVEWFLELCETEDSLLGTRAVEQFLMYALGTHFSFLVDVLERMLESQDESVQRAGARQASLVALELDAAKDLADRCLYGTASMRLGAAEVHAANLQQAALHDVCGSALQVLFQDPDESVRQTASTCFRNLTDAEIGTNQALMDVFIKSPAFTEGHRELIDLLARISVPLPDTICATCERFIDLFGSDVSDIRTAAAAEADDLSTLIIRAYGQAHEEMSRNRCLDLIDVMTEKQAYGLNRAIALYER